MIPDKYSEEFAVPCYMFDVSSRLRPGAFMDIAQELAAKGADQMHFADRDLAPHNLVWILVRMSVVFDKIPVRLDSVTGRTWHRGVGDLIFFLRDYDLLYSDGTTAIRSTSSWVIMDKSTRRVVLPKQISHLITPEPQCPEAALTEAAPRLMMPRGIVAESLGFHTVVYSDLDYNGHTNNAKYVVWAFDALRKLAIERPVKSFSINFNRETHLDDEVELLHISVPGEADSHFVEGLCRGAQSFIMKIDF